MSAMSIALQQSSIAVSCGKRRNGLSFQLFIVSPCANLVRAPGCGERKKCSSFNQDQKRQSCHVSAKPPVKRRLTLSIVYTKAFDTNVTAVPVQRIF